MSVLSSLEEYSRWIAALPARFPEIEHSTLCLWTIDSQRALLKGEVVFGGNVRLRVMEALNLRQGRILEYSYEVYRGDRKLYWYDPWPHPDDPRLASTYPHHKHIPPDIKHHRVPAPGLSFTEPNLLMLIAEIRRDLLGNTSTL